MADTPTLSASLEDYLEVIYQIEKEKQAARAKDIVLRTGLSTQRTGDSNHGYGIGQRSYAGKTG